MPGHAPQVAATPSHAPEARLARARQALEGLSVGDAFGERFFLPNGIRLGKAYYDPDDYARELIGKRATPFETPWRWTDDTQMAASIVSVLRRFGEIEQDALAQSFGERFEPIRDYGGAAYGLLLGYREGRDWHVDAPAMFGGQGSFGNGAAMRVAPVGAYFADDLAKAREQAKRSAEVTHAHREGTDGAIAGAVAAALAARYAQEGVRPSPQQFIDEVIEQVAKSDVRHGLERARKLGSGVGPEEAAKKLGSGYEVSCPDTVPFCIWAAAVHLDNYEEALWATVAGLGDRDTTCAIVGGIVAMYTGVEAIPKRWRDCREALPEWI